jgi:hypothetical protein
MRSSGRHLELHAADYRRTADRVNAIPANMSIPRPADVTDLTLKIDATLPHGIAACCEGLISVGVLTHAVCPCVAVRLRVVAVGDNQGMPCRFIPHGLLAIALVAFACGSPKSKRWPSLLIPWLNPRQDRACSRRSSYFFAPSG